MFTVGPMGVSTGPPGLSRAIPRCFAVGARVAVTMGAASYREALVAK